ncbi:endonuclease [uncultured Polaribacter sp.]|uniref:endonuclease n=1 Tax=uncultured Polaribacter sp. TaxID=174711 RepID=UPI002632D153|nr:endonuclease [uncultured Polaribacter sp.]
MIKKLFLFIFTIVSLNVFSQVQSYYDDVDLQLTGLALKNELATKITATHVKFLDYTPEVWIASKTTDVNPNNPNEVLLIYGFENGSDSNLENDRTRNINVNGGSPSDWNREHVFARSLGNPNLGTVGPGADAHHLRPADPGRNSSRSNRKFGRGSGNSGFSSIDSHQGNDGPNTAAYYPGDEWKGDVARMIMYMYVRYGNVCLPSAVGVGNNTNTPDDMIDLFLKWNVEDPVSDFERARNTYHENTNNTAAQGNRNPFIDNPFLATRIWGGDSAQDTWGIYTNNDNEAPTVPTNVVISNISFTSFDVSWTASTDNEAVTGYDVFVNGTLTQQITTNNTTITNLEPNTNYAITILAKDLVNNKSALSTAVNGRTLEDTVAPSAPTNVVSSNISDTAFTISWTAATDNNEVASYDVYLNNQLDQNVTELTALISGLAATTTYTAHVIAKDTSGNVSLKSNTITINTIEGGNGVANELFISEYVEPNSGNNKAIEIVNLTGRTVSLEGYSLQKQSNGGNWVDNLALDNETFILQGSSTSILPNDVFVIIHSGASEIELTSNADMEVPSNANPPYQFASPLNFNGNDPIGLYKNGVLIDMVGELNNSSNHIQNITLRRNGDISQPNPVFSEQGEWEAFPVNTYSGIGSFTSTLSTEDNQILNAIGIYPNPVKGNKLSIVNKEEVTLNIYNILGNLVKTEKLKANAKQIDISTLSSGVYLINFTSGQKSSSKKFIKL